MKTLLIVFLACLGISVYGQENSGNTTDSTANAHTVTTEVRSMASVATVQPSQQSIRGITHQGLSTTIAASKSHVRKDWKNYLDTYGRVIKKGNTYQIANANISAISATPLQLVSNLSNAGSKRTEIFLALDEGSTPITANSSGYEASQQFLRSFVIQTYRQQATKGVTEAQKDLKKAQKDSDKVLNKQKSLMKKLEHAKKDQANLEKKALNSQTLQTKLNQQLIATEQDKTQAMLKLEKAKSQVGIQQMQLQEIK